MAQRNDIDIELAKTRAVIYSSQHGFHFTLVRHFAPFDPRPEVFHRHGIITAIKYSCKAVWRDWERDFGRDVSVRIVQEFIFNCDFFHANEKALLLHGNSRFFFELNSTSSGGRGSVIAITGGARNKSYR